MPALPDSNRAIVLNPDSADAYYNRGNAYFAQRQYEQALADLCEYVHLAGDQLDPVFLDRIAALETRLGEQCRAE